MAFGKLLEQKMSEKKIKQAELAEATGIPKTTLSSMISRDISKIEIENFLKICKVLDCDPQEFYNDYIKQKQKPLPPSFVMKYNELDSFGQNAVNAILDVEYERCSYVEPEDQAEAINIRRSCLPASAGAGEFLNEENIEMRKYPDCENARRADIVIPVSGDSMEPMFYDGDELYVRLQPAVEIGEIGIFIIEGKGYVKKFAQDRLISINPDYSDIYPSEYSECRCVGKVLGRVE